MNGTDYLMSVFDHQMRKDGFAGNLSHIIIGLPSTIDKAQLQSRLTELADLFPILTARQARGFWPPLPYWKINRRARPARPIVQHHLAEPGDADSLKAVRDDLLNQPLDSRQRELLRLNLISTPNGSMELVMTWPHVLMDGHGSETFLSLLGGNNRLGNAGVDIRATEPENFYTRQLSGAKPFLQEAKQSLAVLRWLDSIAVPPPISLYNMRKSSVRPRQSHMTFAFSDEEMNLIGARISDHCGFLGETAYYLAATILEVHRLAERCGVHQENCVLCMPADSRTKGEPLPVFSNQESFVVYRFIGDQLTSFASAVGAAQSQTRQVLGTWLHSAFDALGRTTRLLPADSYWDRMRRSMNGEISSFLFAHTGNVSPLLRSFMGQAPNYIHHVPSVVCPPGFGVFFYKFASRLNCTVAYADGLLTGAELSKFVACLKQRMLDPECRR